MDLAVYGNGGVVFLRDVAKHQIISDNLLDQIVIPKPKTGLVCSVRGANGGYLLARAPKGYTAGEILRPLEGNLVPAECDTDAEFCRC